MDNVKVGGWWGGLLPFIGAILALIGANRGYIVGACVLASLGIVMAIAAAITDSIASGIVNSLDTCALSNNGVPTKFYGSKSGDAAINAYYCAYGESSGKCYCNNGDSTCYIYELADDSNDCDYVLTTYGSNLSASAAFCWLVFISSLVFAIFTCVSVCAAPKGDAANGEATAVVVNGEPAAANKA